jgi:alkylhydroperoxidase family enzyme
VRFDQAREAGLTEDDIAHLDGESRAMLPERLQVALAWADMLLAGGHVGDPTLEARMRRHFSEAEIVELTYAMGTFIGYGKQIMILGLEPESMPLTVVHTPGT